MLKKIAIVLVAGVVVCVVVVALQPADYRIVRSATIAAPPAAVFAQVNDFHKWQTWSPWAKRDPAAKNSFEGAPAGTGAAFTWVGNHEVGAGRLTITESRPNDLIRIRLDFLKPFASTATAEFTFKPDGDGTAVTWSMHGERSFLSKAIGLVLNMDRMIGGDFESGLASIRSVTESAAKS